MARSEQHDDGTPRSAHDDASLDRFVVAQAGMFDTALAELKAGRKQSHWMWFVFPQIAGLGHSAMARRYAIADLHEARDYLAHPLLGARLRQASEAMLGNEGRSAEAVLGDIDATKLRSSMTLFEAAEGDEIHGRVLDAFYAGMRDPATLSRL